MEYRTVPEHDITRRLFDGFVRRQEVDLCLRREGDAWAVRSDPFVDDWTEDDYRVLVGCLRATAHTGGLVYGAFAGGTLKGFASVESSPFGSSGQYLDLTSLHVSQDMRRHGIGRALFRAAADWARGRGARKLYISSHSAVETQEFYRALGCVDAREPNQAHVEAEPYDRQLEYAL